MRAKQHHRRDAEQGGFTLVEILVAMSLLGISMYVLLQTHYNTLIMFSEVHEAAELRMMIEETIGAAEMEVLAGEKSGNGELGEEEEEITYAFEAKEVESDTLDGVWDVHVTIQSPGMEPYEFDFRIHDGSQEVLQ